MTIDPWAEALGAIRGRLQTEIDSNEYGEGHELAVIAARTDAIRIVTEEMRVAYERSAAEELRQGLGPGRPSDEGSAGREIAGDLDHEVVRQLSNTAPSLWGGRLVVDDDERRADQFIGGCDQPAVIDAMLREPFDPVDQFANHGAGPGRDVCGLINGDSHFPGETGDRYATLVGDVDSRRRVSGVVQLPPQRAEQGELGSADRVPGLRRFGPLDLGLEHGSVQRRKKRAVVRDRDASGLHLIEGVLNLVQKVRCTSRRSPKVDDVEILCALHVSRPRAHDAVGRLREHRLDQLREFCRWVRHGVRVCQRDDTAAVVVG